MKIYKLDIDTSKPIRKVVQMQQNSTGALSVDVTNDGWLIRNLSCALYDGETELSAYAELSSGAGYKIDVGDETKVVKFTAKSTPVECSEQYILSAPSGVRVRSIWLNCVQLEAGTYKQDEFQNVANKFANPNGIHVNLTVHANDLSNANFGMMRITHSPNTNESKLYFFTGNGSAGSFGDLLPEDQPIIVTGPVNIGKTQTYKSNGTATLSSYNYPAVGYWTDYSLDTVIRPSENAHCYAEQEVTDPEPEPTPDPEEPVEPTEG